LLAKNSQQTLQISKNGSSATEALGSVVLNVKAVETIVSESSVNADSVTNYDTTQTLSIDDDPRTRHDDIMKGNKRHENEVVRINEHDTYSLPTFMNLASIEGKIVIVAARWLEKMMLVLTMLSRKQIIVRSRQLGIHV
jgi:hypothetical protein